MKITKEMPVYGIVVDAFIKEIERLPNDIGVHFCSDYDGEIVIDDFYFGLGDGYLIVAPKSLHLEAEALAAESLELILEDIDQDEIAGAVKRRRDIQHDKVAKEAQAKIEEYNRIKRERDEAFLDRVMERFGVLAA